MASTLGRFTRDAISHRNSFQNVDQLRKSMDPSVDPPKDHRSSDPGTSSIFTSISTIFGFVDFVAAINEVSDDNRIFISLIDRVRDDVDEAFRLRRCRKVADRFASFPRERCWIDSVIMDVQRALNDLGLYVENARVELGGRVEVKMRNKFEWVLRNPQKLITRQIALSTCHQSLVVAIQAMQAAEMGTNPRSPENDPASFTSGNALLGPYTRRKKRSISARTELQMTAQEIEMASENLPEPVMILPTSLPPISSQDAYLRPKLSLRGTSGYFPSLPVLQQNSNPYPELPGCLPASHSMPNLPGNDVSALSHDSRQQIPRKPMAPNTKALPYLPRHPSLRSTLSEWIIPWNEIQSDIIVDAASPTSSNSGTITSSPDTVSSTESTSPVRNTTSGLGRAMTTQERRRLAHTRRLAAAYDDED